MDRSYISHSGKKRICIVMGSHWAGMMGGAQYQVRFITEELVKTEKYDVFYVARQVSNSYVPQGYRIQRVSSMAGRTYGSFLFDMPSLSKMIREINPDVVYQRGLQPYTGVAAYAAHKGRGKFIFHIAHDYDVMPFEYKFWPIKNTVRALLGKIEREVGEYGLCNADKVIAQTSQQADLFQSRYGRLPDAIIPNFHPHPEEEITKPEDIIRVVWVANFKKTKQPELFVDLAETFLGREDVEFIMVGRRGDPNVYGALHDRMSRIRNLVYRGELPVNEVNSILATAHIFVNTSLAEGFPNTFIQAWMRQVPVVSMFVTVDDTLEKQRMGFLARDFESMCKIIGSLIDNRELRKDMGKHAQKIAFERYSTGNLRELLSVIES